MEEPDKSILFSVDKRSAFNAIEASLSCIHDGSGMRQNLTVVLPPLQTVSVKIRKKEICTVASIVISLICTLACFPLESHS